MRRIITVVAIAMATFLSVVTGQANAQTASNAGYLYAELDMEGAVQITPCISGYFQLLIDDYDGVSVFYVYGNDHCSSNQEVFSVWAAPHTSDFDLYTGGFSINTRLNGTDFDHAKPYDVWLNLQLACVGTIYRYHPGSDCGGPLTGRIAFGKYAFAPPAGGTAGMDWRYWPSRLP